jgi:hypothetical protein
VRWKTRRSAVSELFASLLMVGVTLAFGSVVTATSVNQFSTTGNSYSLGVSVQESSAGKQVSLIYGTVPVPGSGGCATTYRGYTEGTAYSVALYYYGSVPFTPAEIFDNGTLLSGGPYGTIAAGSMATYNLTLPSCAHPSGQVLLLVDANGDEVQVET